MYCQTAQERARLRWAFAAITMSVGPPLHHQLHHQRRICAITRAWGLELCLGWHLRRRRPNRMVPLCVWHLLYRLWPRAALPPHSGASAAAAATVAVTAASSPPPPVSRHLLAATTVVPTGRCRSRHLRPGRAAALASAGPTSAASITAATAAVAATPLRHHPGATASSPPPPLYPPRCRCATAAPPPPTAPPPRGLCLRAHHATAGCATAHRPLRHPDGDETLGPLVLPLPTRAWTVPPSGLLSLRLWLSHETWRTVRFMVLYADEGWARRTRWGWRHADV